MRRLWITMLALTMLVTTTLPAFAQSGQPAVAGPGSGSIFQVGIQYAYPPFGGITLKRRITSGVMLQGTIALSETTGFMGGRMLFDLGTKGEVFRYTGFGVGTGYSIPWSESTGPLSLNTVGVEAIIGIDYPMSFFGRSTPFSVSLEAALQVIRRTNSETTTIHPRTGVNAGVSYWF